MIDVDPRPDVPTAQLVREALEEARALVKAEVALAKDEVRREVSGMTHAILAFGAALGLGLLGVAFLLIAFLLGTFPHVLPALIVGLVLLAIAGTAAGVGIASLPKKPMAQTTERVEHDLHVLEETLA
jgi:hypothetical protein